ncbi:hypothetical protein L6164_008280 [Bauhinia variegata]|uniref:Uncharacterized protein n=1 Tax=Bauhinia variegata TaxID=167791 RepID=A0ACB9PGH3_BAUVA|nr:hypothetical protein L6164_008280 [Bauhinia variegata]
MFPFHQNNDSLFQISCDLQEQDTIQQYQIWGQQSLEGSDPAQVMGKGKQHIILPTWENNEASVGNDDKKIIRRENERERRMQMSTLCASLRSLLPFELIKGKRSESDHIGEAVKYILYLKEKIDVLHMKRDKLKRMANPCLIDAGIESSNHSSLVNYAKIDLFPGGAEITIDSGFEESSLPLSHILEILLQEGYDNIVSYVSTKVNGRIVHSIKSEVGRLTQLDVVGMQQKLNNAIFP